MVIVNHNPRLYAVCVIIWSFLLCYANKVVYSKQHDMVYETESTVNFSSAACPYSIFITRSCGEC